jgi:uncharacterized protein YbbK (DUF523 family)/uncharacterized protein YbgA (DUF1722 family)
MPFAVPRVVVSKCLEFEACRYNGQCIPFDLITELEPFVEYVPVCPEVEVGLGTPRPPVRLVAQGARQRLFQPETGRDLTSEMDAFATCFLDGVSDVDGFILKSRSPSCGPNGVKVYDRADAPSAAGRSPGRFAAHVLERAGHLALEDEGRLRNYRIREHFLTKLFGLARLREARSMRDLVALQARYKLVLMAYNQSKMRELGRLVANHDRRPFEAVLADYWIGFGLAMRKAPRATAIINTVEHAYGYVSSELNQSEKRFYRTQLRRYREGRIPVSGLTSLINAWAARLDVSYLLEQAFFLPFPDALMNLSDSGKGRLARPR